MHKLSRAIVQYAESRNIDTIVIGHNDVNLREVRIIPQGTGYTVEIVVGLVVEILGEMAQS